MKQFPVLTPEQVSSSGYEQDIVERVARLCWFNHDLDGWMEELREECPEEYDLPEEPVIWDEEQRTVWQAELDAIFAHLYGLTTEDLRYILDPEDVCGKGCINETFRVLKERELRELGEYRTKRLVMEAWNKFEFDNKLKCFVMRNKWFEEQIVEFKTRSDSEVLEFLSSYWNITPDVKGVFTMVGTYKRQIIKIKRK